jgi:hypothetical protein
MPTRSKPSKAKRLRVHVELLESRRLLSSAARSSWHDAIEALLASIQMPASVGPQQTPVATEGQETASGVSTPIAPVTGGDAGAVTAPSVIIDGADDNSGKKDKNKDKNKDKGGDVEEVADSSDGNEAGNWNGNSGGSGGSGEDSDGGMVVLPDIGGGTIIETPVIDIPVEIPIETPIETPISTPDLPIDTGLPQTGETPDTTGPVVIDNGGTETDTTGDIEPESPVVVVVPENPASNTGGGDIFNGGTPIGDTDTGNESPNSGGSVVIDDGGSTGSTGSTGGSGSSDVDTDSGNTPTSPVAQTPTNPEPVASTGGNNNNNNNFNNNGNGNGLSNRDGQSHHNNSGSNGNRGSNSNSSSHNNNGGSQHATRTTQSVTPQSQQQQQQQEQRGNTTTASTRQPTSAVQETESPTVVQQPAASIATQAQPESTDEQAVARDTSNEQTGSQTATGNSLTPATTVQASGNQAAPVAAAAPAAPTVAGDVETFDKVVDAEGNPNVEPDVAEMLEGNAKYGQVNGFAQAERARRTVKRVSVRVSTLSELAVIDPEQAQVAMHMIAAGETAVVASAESGEATEEQSVDVQAVAGNRAFATDTPSSRNINILAAVAAGASVLATRWMRWRKRKLATVANSRLANMLQFDPLAVWLDDPEERRV